MISILTFLPVATSLALLLVGRSARAIRLTALFGSLATFGFALALLCSFDPTLKGYQPYLTESSRWVPSLGISYKVGIGGISLFLVALAALTAHRVLSSWTSIEKRVLEFR
jgi:NADH-quinone oxidoreductase subunit M